MPAPELVRVVSFVMAGAGAALTVMGEWRYWRRRHDRWLDRTDERERQWQALERHWREL